MNQRVHVVRDFASRFGDPLALYQEGRFIRLREVQRRESIDGKGCRYLCTVQGQQVELWQERERDVWYLEQSLPQAVCG